MRCQDVECLILKGCGLGPEVRAEVDAHLARCSDWREFWLALHERVSRMPTPELPSGLAESVRRAAHAELVFRSDKQAARAPAEAGPAVPGFIWAAFAAITILTLGFLIPGVQDFMENQKFTLGTVLVLILILQNTLTLVFAPVVLRRQRHFQGG